MHRFTLLTACLALVTTSVTAPLHAQSRRGRTQVVGTPAAPAMRPAMMYSCMTMPADGPPMVDASVPRAIELQAPGYGITRYTDEPAPLGWSLWRITGGLRREGQGEHISHVLGWDGAHVVEGAQLFLAMSSAAPSASPWHLARRALAVLFRRSEELPLRTADNATASETVRGRIAEPAIRDGRLVFWARTQPGLPYAHEVEVDLSTGRVERGNVW